MRRNFCFAKIRRPVLRAIRFGFITNLCRRAVLGNIVHIPHGWASSRCGLSWAPAPTHLCRFFFVAKSLAFFADFTLCYGTEKAVQSFSLRHRFVFGFLLFIRGYPYTFCPLPPILDSRQDTVSRLPDFRLHTQISDLPAR